MKKPLKRHIALQPLSREHHHGLLLCWKIRTGLRKGIRPERIKQYVNWFYENHIESHFHAEETYIFPILGFDHQWVKKAITQHRRLVRLFNAEKEITKSLSLLEEELEGHIRFEERILFNEVQKVATNTQLEMIKKHHIGGEFEENTKDEFWT